MINFSFKSYDLKFNSVIRTSRGKMNTRKSWFIFLNKNNKTGIGEVAPIFRLSKETEKEIIKELNFLNNNFNENYISKYPSIQFALETAKLDLQNGGKRIIFKNNFTQNKIGIPINGLIWMSSFNKMKNEIALKLSSGFNCIKIKIGSINFEKEVELIKYIRSKSDDIIIRVDANGAFKYSEVFSKLDKLSKFNIHSIEQPIKTKQFEKIKNVCCNSPIPIALDEELIGLSNYEEILSFIKPQFIVLKPSLIGGFSFCNTLINFAIKNKIGYWITSALESNIGLNSLAQWTSTLENNYYQGLGTGNIYSNNFNSPLYLKNDKLFFYKTNKWDLHNLNV